MATLKYDLRGTRLHLLPSGDLLIATSSPEPRGGPLGGLVRLAPNGEIRHRAPFHHPHDVPHSERGEYDAFGIGPIASTTDHAVVLGGSYGPGPSGWWWGKFTPDGVRLAERTGRIHFPMSVDAVTALPDGGFALILRNLDRPAMALDVVLERYAASGQRLARRVLVEKGECPGAAFTSDGRIAIMRCGTPHRLMYFTGEGAPIRELPWPTSQGETLAIASDGTGILLMEEADSARVRINRLDRDGAVVWRTAKAKYGDVTSAAGDVAMLSLDADGKAATLLRYAKP